MNRGHYLTKPELIFLEECQKRGIDIEKQFPLKNSFILDFAIPEKKIAVEIDGNHWHNYPHGTKRDRIKDAILRKKGWKVLRYWESEVYSDIEKIIDNLVSLLLHGDKEKALISP